MTIKKVSTTKPKRGRPRGSKNSTATGETKKLLSDVAREEALHTGLLPHEWLLKVSRGECIKQRKLVTRYYANGPKKGEKKDHVWVEEDFYPDFATRTDCAKAAAPYYAPRLATQTIEAGGKTIESIDKVFAVLAEKLPV